MKNVARINADTAGGTILQPLAPSVFVNGYPIAVLHCQVQGHGGGPHAAPVMVESSKTVFAEGIPVCRAGDSASCGHKATGSPNVFAGD